MAFDGVPWLVGGGAEHSPEIARTLAYAATNGATGVIGPSDMKVLPLATPGTSVRIMPGGAAMLNKSPGARAESYMGRAPSETNVLIAPTGAGVTRRDVVIGRIEDPQYQGWTTPADPKVGPYFKPYVIQNVTQGQFNEILATRSLDTLGLTYSAVPLAGITVPPSTATITSGMVTDFRSIANPRRTRSLQSVGFNPGQQLGGADGVWQPWPNPGSANIRAPYWANFLTVKADLTNIFATPPPADGNWRINIDGTPSFPAYMNNDQASAGGGNVYNYGVIWAGAISWAGLERAIVSQGQRVATSAHPDGRFSTFGASLMILDIEFTETVV